MQRSLKHQSPKIQVFSDSKHEKAVRGRLKSEVLIIYDLLCHGDDDGDGDVDGDDDDDDNGDDR